MRPRRGSAIIIVLLVLVLAGVVDTIVAVVKVVCPIMTCRRVIGMTGDLVVVLM